MSVIASLVSFGAHALPHTRTNRLMILIYHRVQPVVDGMFPGEVTATQFDEQMGLLRRYCTPLALRDAVVSLREHRLPARAVAITFDDGYADNATVALPILQRHGVPATFFIATDFLDGGLMWNDIVIESVRRAQGTTFDLSAIDQGSAELGAPLARGALAQRILRAIKHLPPPERAARVAAIRQQAAVSLPTDLMMASDQVRQLAAAGMEIGAHTLTHPILRTLSDEQASNEIAASRARLESLIQKPVTAFAYPNGRPGEDYDVRDRDLVGALGFEYAVSTRAGAATGDSDRFQLPRFTPWDRKLGSWFARLLMTYRQAA